MNATIIFGSKKLGQATTTVANEKYPDLAVVTIEGQKGAKKSRRILINAKAAELLSLETGSIQELVFASVEMGATDQNQVLIANAGSIDNDDMVVYKTSKNNVSFGEDTKEKGKAVTSSHMCNEIFSFLGQDDSANIEFQLVEFPSEEVEAYAFTPISEGIDELSTPASALEADVEAEIIETNNGSMTTEELTESVQAKVAQDEANDPIFIDESAEMGIEDSEEARGAEQPVVDNIDWA